MGNDTGLFVTIDGGNRWVKMNNNIPNIPVHDLLVHPRENDLVVGSYGRGLFLTNIAPLQELDERVLGQGVHLFAVEPTVQRVTWSFGANDYLFADAHIRTPNEPSGMVIRYYLKGQMDEGATIIVSDFNGVEVARLEGETAAGINIVVWSMRPQSAGGARGGGGGGALDRLVPPGEYVVTVEIGGESFTRSATITSTQGWSLGPFPKVIR